MKFLLYILLINSSVLAQTKQLDFILIINDKIVSESVIIKCMSLKKNEKDYKIIGNAKYHPGNLSIKEEVYTQLISDSVASINLVFNFYTQDGGKIHYYSYEIPYNQKWLEAEYCILSIYNLDRGKYKNKLDPLSSTKNYTFEITSPNFTFIKVRKK